MPDPSQLPASMAKEIRQRFDDLFGEHKQQPPPLPTEVEQLAALGFDGSRLRRRYWKKVTER